MPDQADHVLDHVTRALVGKGIVGRFIRDMPRIDLVSGRDDEPLRAVQLHPRGDGDGTGRRTQDGSDSAALEPEHGHAEVLGFDVVVEHPDLALDAFDLPHVPAKQVDLVHGLVDQRPAAVQRPGTVPTFVVSVVPEPLQPHLTQDHPPESPIVHGLLDAHVVGHVPRFEIHGQDHAGLAAGRDHPVRPFQVDLHGLGGDDMLARLRGRDGKIRVGAAGRHHRDDVDIVAVEQPAVVPVPVDAVLRLGLPAPFLVELGHGHEPRAFRLADETGAHRAHAKPYHAETDGIGAQVGLLFM